MSSRAVRVENMIARLNSDSLREFVAVVAQPGNIKAAEWYSHSFLKFFGGKSLVTFSFQSVCHVEN